MKIIKKDIKKLTILVVFISSIKYIIYIIIIIFNQIKRSYINLLYLIKILIIFIKK